MDLWSMREYVLKEEYKDISSNRLIYCFPFPDQ